MKVITISEAAVIVLKELRRPATLFEIYSGIINKKLYLFGARDPLNVLRVTLDRQCINKSLEVMHNVRSFEKLKSGEYKLIDELLGLISSEFDTEEDPFSKINNFAKLHLSKTKENILNTLQGLSSDEFEFFCKIFLEKYGFSKMILTRRGRDGGIDVKGKLRIGLADMRVAVQCKRYSSSNKVGRTSISAFRGDITGDFEQGIFITTSTFTAECRNISFKPGCVPIILIDGQQLSEIMIERGIGIQKKIIEVYDFEKDLLWE